MSMSKKSFPRVYKISDLSRSPAIRPKCTKKNFSDRTVTFEHFYPEKQFSIGDERIFGKWVGQCIFGIRIFFKIFRKKSLSPTFQVSIS